MARVKNGDFTANSGLIDYWDVYFSWLAIHWHLITPIHRF